MKVLEAEQLRLREFSADDAIADPGNRSSISLLEKIGMRFEKTISLTSGGPEMVYYGISPGKAVDA